MRGRAEFEQLTRDEGRMECRFVFCAFLFHDAFEAGNEHILRTSIAFCLRRSYSLEIRKCFDSL